MKTIEVGIILMVALFFCLPYHLYLVNLSKKHPEKAWSKARKFVSGFFRTELKISGCKVKIIGAQNIPKDGPALFVGNHRSYFDILVYHEAIGKPVGFLAKKEMLKLPLLPLYMKDIGCLFLDRNDIKQGLEVIKQATEYMKQGHSMIVFPEGTRNQTETLYPFREGGYKIAEKSKSPIVPVAVSGTNLMLESDPKKRIHSHEVVIEFGEPIYPTELSPKERKETYAQFPAMIQAMRDSHNIKDY